MPLIYFQEGTLLSAKRQVVMMTSEVLKKKVIEQRSLKEDTSLGVKFCNTTKEQLFFIRLKRKK